MTPLPPKRKNAHPMTRPRLPLEEWLLIKAIGAVKVTRSAVENACSIAAMILTTSALVTDIPEKEKAPAMPQGGGMDM